MSPEWIWARAATGMPIWLALGVTCIYMGEGMNPGNLEEGMHHQDSGQIGHGPVMLASVSQVPG